MIIPNKGIVVKEPSPKLIISLACATFLVCGLWNGAIGPVLTELAAKSSSPLTAVGGVITFLFLGALVAQLVTGPIIDNLGIKGVLITSLILLSIGIVGFTFARSLTSIFIFFLIAGLGQGAQNLAINLIVSNTFREKNTTYLNLLHFFFGLGAFSGPAFVSLSISLKASPFTLHWATSGLYALTAVVFVLFYKNQKPQPTQQPGDRENEKGLLYRSPLLWVLGFFLLVYVASEYGLGSWSTAFMGVAAGMSVEKAALVTSAYWGVFTLGRLSGTFISRKLSIIKQLSVSVIGALLCGIAFVLVVHDKIPMIVAMVAIAFCLGPIFPTLMALTARAFPGAQGKAVGLVSAMSSVGGLSLPLLDGYFVERANPQGYTLFNLGILATVTLFYILTVMLVNKLPQKIN